MQVAAAHCRILGHSRNKTRFWFLGSWFGFQCPWWMCQILIVAPRTGSYLLVSSVLRVQNSSVRKRDSSSVGSASVTSVSWTANRLKVSDPPPVHFISTQRNPVLITADTLVSSQTPLCSIYLHLFPVTSTWSTRWKPRPLRPVTLRETLTLWISIRDLN